MKRHFAALIAAGIGFCASTPALADPPPWAPAHGYRAKQEQARSYRYVYYPAQQVYYAPEQRLWFWMGGSGWQFGASLPVRYQPANTSGVTLTLASSRPYTEHVYVEENYGKPWREEHGHGNGRGHDKHKEKHKDKHKEKHGRHHGHDD